MLAKIGHLVHNNLIRCIQINTYYLAIFCSKLMILGMQKYPPGYYISLISYTNRKQVRISIRSHNITTVMYNKDKIFFSHWFQWCSPKCSPKYSLHEATMYMHTVPILCQSQIQHLPQSLESIHSIYHLKYHHPAILLTYIYILGYNDTSNNCFIMVHVTSVSHRILVKRSE